MLTNSNAHSLLTFGFNNPLKSPFYLGLLYEYLLIGSFGESGRSRTEWVTCTVVAHGFNPSTGQAEADRPLWAEASRGCTRDPRPATYIVKPCLKTRAKKPCVRDTFSSLRSYAAISEDLIWNRLYCFFKVSLHKACLLCSVFYLVRELGVKGKHWLLEEGGEEC